METESFEAVNIAKDYNGISVIHDISLTVKPGEIIGLLGPNGAGKTTLFYIMMGLIKPRKGDILIGNETITQLAMYSRARLGISYLPQEPSIFRGMNVRDNINSILEISEANPKVREEKLSMLLETFGLNKIQKNQARLLSGGERRRVEIARALATNPRYILMDEPFSGVDPIAIDDIKRIIKSLSKSGIGVLITDHNVRETLTLIDRAYIIYEGNLLISGTPEIILNSQEVKKVYLGDQFNM